MTPVLVDSNVLLDIATSEPKWFGWSEAALGHAASDSLLFRDGDIRVMLRRLCSTGVALKYANG